MNKDSNDVFKVFDEFCDSLNSDKLKKTSYLIEKINKVRESRLKKHGLTVDEIIKVDKDSIELFDTSNKNQTFSNAVYSVRDNRTLNYYKNKDLIRVYENDAILYANVAYINDEKRIYHHNYNCPNCGNLLTIKTLLDGCTHCKTKFIVSDMYPIITNYYQVDINKKIEEEKYINGKKYSSFDQSLEIVYIIIISIVFSVLTCPPLIILLTNGDLYGSNPFLIILLFLIEFFIYYFNFNFIVKTNNKRNLKKVERLVETKNNKYPLVLDRNEVSYFEDYMKAYDPNFSFFHFQGKITSMFKEIQFSDGNTYFYKSDSKIDFTNYINSDYNGGIEMDGASVKDGYIYLNVIFYSVDTLIESNGEISRYRHKYRVTVCRKSDVITTSDFRIRGINCKNCGSPIDFEKDNHCDHCNSSYKLEDYEFIFTDIKILETEKY